MNIAQYLKIKTQIDDLNTQDRELRQKERTSYGEQSRLKSSYGCGLEVTYLRLPTRVSNLLRKANLVTIDQVMFAVLSADAGQIPIEGFRKKSWTKLIESLSQAHFMPESRQALEEKRQRLAQLQTQDQEIATQRAAVKTTRDRLAALIGDTVPLQRLNLNPRACNRLNAVGYATVSDIIVALIQRGPQAVLPIHQFGEKSWEELLRRLREAGYMPDDLGQSWEAHKTK